VVLADGELVRAADVVLATGHPTASRPVAVDARHPDYVDDPWRAGALEAIDPHVPVLLIGAGLTAVDAALTLTADGRRDAPVTLVSRRGQLPLTHTVRAAPPAVPVLDDCGTLRDVVRAVRESAAQAGDWRAVVDGMRPYLDKLWVARGSVTATGWRPRWAPGWPGCGPRAGSRYARAACARWSRRRPVG
jgi:uncharacterized NAD(P)/FAD-binding protein YdhS